MSTYDYVVVGAGSAGCVLAARLSEDPAVSVALIEAGGPDLAQEVHIPLAFSQLFKTPLDWDLDTEPEPELGGRRAYLPRGKMLGGSSSMNAMIYMRGNRADYDGWARAGAAGWSWADVLPYFKRAEDNERGANDLHGAGGPLTVSDGRSNHPLAAAFVEAGVQAGHPRTDDFNGERQEGVGFYQLTQRNGLRCSAADAYLRPALERPNLTLLTGALAQRVLLDGSRARGVEIARGGETEVVTAAGEVLVAAGAYESPKLLMLSGIGPEAVLTPFGIPVEANLPVGQGLQDHCLALLNYATRVETLMTALTPENVVLLMSEGHGPLSSNVAESGGFFHSLPGLPAPDVQFHVAPVLFHEEGLGALVAHAITLAPCVLAPTSRGQVLLRWPRPEVAPRIIHNYLTTQEDRDCLVAGVRLAFDIEAQPALQAVTTGAFNVPASDAEADILDWARRVVMTLYHPTSTCAIGSVVDPDLRVLGFEGLRIVDASVLPTVPRGNTNAPTIMVAERAADLILGRTLRATAGVG
ncbi:MAG: GMC family oxidoreductase N-terminal domain-containing protein [Candidatus Dormiibacterota bacterium]